MADLSYLNFDLQLETAGEALRAQVIDSPAGPCEHSFRLPFTRQQWDYLRRSGDFPLPQGGEAPAAQLLGERLFQEVFGGKVGVSYRTSLRMAQTQGKGLRIRLRFNQILLTIIPWEYLYDPEQGKFLALSTETPLARYLALPQPTPTIATQPPLGVLTVFSGPVGYTPLDKEAEWHCLQQALAGLVGRGLAQIERVHPPSLAALQRQLRQGAYQVFHFVGHGDFIEHNGVLIFEDEHNQPVSWGGRELAAVLADHRHLRLVILNTCRGGRLSTSRVFSGVAQALVQQNVPAVIAMQKPISDRAALAFAQEFYAALGEGYPIDAALSEARKAILANGMGIEWATPVYYSNVIEGQLLDLKKADTFPLPPPSLAAERPPAPTLQAGVTPLPVQPGAAQRIFISYRRKIPDDEYLAQLLYDALEKQGHLPFIDRNMQGGTDWLDEIDRQIQQSDFLLVLLSNHSAHSEMVKSEVRRAYNYRRRCGKPVTIPVRINFEDDDLPYSIDAFIGTTQYVLWKDQTDDRPVVDEILAVVSGKAQPVSKKPPAPEHPRLTIISEDGRILAKPETAPPAGVPLSVPLPEFDPRFLDNLNAPGGTLQPSDYFYIEREADQRLRRELLGKGTTTTIRGSRQVGKSSLLARGLSQTNDQARLVHLDLQAANRGDLEDINIFLRYISTCVARQLRIAPETVTRRWQESLGPQDKFIYFMEDSVLSEDQRLLIFAMDEADRLLETSFSPDFFALMRACHNERAVNRLWRVFNLVMIISTEPYLLIPDHTQSPFNVGRKLVVDDFTAPQVADLNKRHGAPVSQGQLPQFYALLGGHPYLTRKALYTLVADKVAWDELLASAIEDHGPFGDHLRHLLWLLRDEPGLREALKQIIRTQRCKDDMAVFRLQHAGFIRGSGDVYQCRCDLYAQYFREKLSS